MLKEIKDSLILLITLLGVLIFIPLIVIIGKIEWAFKGYNKLHNGSICPKCKKGIMKLHRYSEMGYAHILECYKCGFKLDGIEE